MLLGDLGSINWSRIQGKNADMSEPRRRQLGDIYEGEYSQRQSSNLGTVGYYSTYTSAVPTYTSDAALASTGAGTGTPVITGTAPIDSSVASSITATPSSGSDVLTNLLTAVGSAAATVATGAVMTAALQATNAQRLAQGLPPLNANGTVMTQAQMQAAGYSTAQIAAVSSQLAMDPTTIMIIAGVAIIGGFLLLSKKS